MQIISSKEKGLNFCRQSSSRKYKKYWKTVTAAAAAAFGIASICMIPLDTSKVYKGATVFVL